MATIAIGAVGIGVASGQASVAASPEESLNAASTGQLDGSTTRTGMPIPADLSRSGHQTYLLKLDPAPTTRAFKRARTDGKVAARSAARTQRGRIAATQADVAASLPARTSVLYRTHSVIAGLAVQSSAENFGDLKEIPGVAAVYPVAPKQFENSYAVPLQGAPAAWTSPGGDLGDGIKIAVVDTGIDYTHADFDGPGTVGAYETAKADEAGTPDPGLFPNDKVIGGYDFVGDTYNGDQSDPEYQPIAHPDDNPLDCEGHGSHVAGSAAGLGVAANGSTYTGDYDESTDFGAMKIGPGMAPGAKLLAYKVFGCGGTTSWISAAIDKAADPNGDGDPSDGADVINLSVGSTFGSAEDGDSIAANAAVDLGVSVVASAGNDADRTDISGSPGNASKVITVANSQDAASRVDGTTVSIDGTPDTFGSSRSVEYDWSADPDLSGEVVRAPSDNRTACTAYPAGTFSGEVVLVEWTDLNLECGSVVRSGNLAAAGAGGFIFGSSEETFSAGITGSAAIPGVLMAKSGADAVRDALEASDPVEVQGTSVNTVTQSFPEDDDKVSPSSSRGIHAVGNVKPDVTAVGTSVFSAGAGTGDQGISESGTSMSSPMVAGLAALVQSANPGWTPLQIKADIMNTATHDIYENGAADPVSTVFSPIRVGAGRIDAEQAMNNDVLAFNPEDGTVSVSFGPVEADGPMTLSKEVTVQNTGGSAVTYDTSYEQTSSVPGVEYSVSPSQVTVAAGTSETVTVTLAITDVGAMTKTVDPTTGRMSTALELPRETLSEASGRILLEPTVIGPTLRVPVYAAPRPVSEMSQPGSLPLSAGREQEGQLNLTGTDLGRGGSNGTGDADPDNDIFSIAAGFELQATSGMSPQCGGSVTTRCIRLAEEGGADLKQVGYTSDGPYTTAEDSQAYFALTTHAPFSIPSGKMNFQVDIDVDGDHEADVYLVNNRLVQGEQDEDVFVSDLFDPDDPEGGSLDLQPLNGRFGDLDTALYDSDTMVLPFSTKALEEYGINKDNPRINYGVVTYSNYSDQLIDAVGIESGTGKVQLSADLFEPGVTVTDSSGSGPLVRDIDGRGVTVTRDVDSYREDRGEGLLMLHFHNEVGDKGQAVGLAGVPPAIKATVSSSKPKNSRGWYRTPVTVSFDCVTGTLDLTGECPGPVSLAGNGVNQSVSRTITASDGQAATASIGNIDIDRTRPTLRIKGVRRGAKYRKPPKGRCVAKDKLSKVASCKLKRKRRGKRITYTATAIDKAGNSRTVRVRARIRR